MKVVSYKRKRRTRKRSRKSKKQRGGSAPTVVFTLTNGAGFGSVTNFLLHAYVYAKETGKEFFIEHRDWQYGQWHDYFKSLKVLDPKNAGQAEKFQHSSTGKLPIYPLKKYTAAIQEIFVLTDALKAKANDFVKSIGTPYKAIYVRMGDKVEGGSKEMNAMDLKTLLKGTDITTGDTLFVQTDDYSVVKEIQANLPGTKVTTMTPTDATGAVHEKILASSPEQKKAHAEELFTSMQVFLGASKGWIDNRSNLGRFLKMASPSTICVYPEPPNNADITEETPVNPPHRPIGGPVT